MTLKLNTIIWCITGTADSENMYENTLPSKKIDLYQNDGLR